MYLSDYRGHSIFALNSASFNSNKRSAAKRARRSSASFVAISIDYCGGQRPNGIFVQPK